MTSDLSFTTVLSSETTSDSEDLPEVSFADQKKCHTSDDVDFNIPTSKSVSTERHSSCDRLSVGQSTSSDVHQPSSSTSLCQSSSIGQLSYTSWLSSRGQQPSSTSQSSSMGQSSSDGLFIAM